MIGLPEFDFPPLDPLIYEYGNAILDSGIIYGMINASNFVINGLAKTRFLGARSYFVNEVFRLELDIQIPQIAAFDEIDSVGTLGGFRMGGHGYVNVTLEGIQATWIIEGHVTNDTWTVEDFNSTPSVKKMKLHFEDLFGKGNKKLNALVMTFVNEFWPVLLRVTTPIGVQTLNPWLCNLVNRFFLKVSFTKIFP
ncbi:uncharacterized protein [Linepithema humile]|uniref:uncharacterized protein n=1 Tax=Linepithema humile TaxID=83485 RepID=UPI00351F0E42